jgi:hypothetical protein
VETAPPAPSVTPSAVVAPAATVRLSIVTEPPGAVVTKDGFQICDETPCDIDVQKDARLTLEAKKGALRGSAKVQAKGDQAVNIKLVAPSGGKPAAQICYKEVIEGDLKVMKPTPCN